MCQFSELKHVRQKSFQNTTCHWVQGMYTPQKPRPKWFWCGTLGTFQWKITSYGLLKGWPRRVLFAGSSGKCSLPTIWELKFRPAIPYHLWYNHRKLHGFCGKNATRYMSKELNPLSVIMKFPPGFTNLTFSSGHLSYWQNNVPKTTKSHMEMVSKWVITYFQMGYIDTLWL